MVAKKEMMMVASSRLVVDGNARNLDHSDLTLFHKLFQRTVDRGPSQMRNLLLRLLADFIGCQRAVRLPDCFTQDQLLLRSVRHRVIVWNLNVRHKYQNEVAHRCNPIAPRITTHQN